MVRLTIHSIGGAGVSCDVVLVTDTVLYSGRYKNGRDKDKGCPKFSDTTRGKSIPRGRIYRATELHYYSVRAQATRNAKIYCIIHTVTPSCCCCCCCLICSNCQHVRISCRTHSLVAPFHQRRDDDDTMQLLETIFCVTCTADDGARTNG